MQQISESFKKRAVGEYLDANKQVYFEVDEDLQWVSFFGFSLNHFGLKPRMTVADYLHQLQPEVRQNFKDLAQALYSSESHELPINYHFLCFTLKTELKDLVVIQDFWIEQQVDGKRLHGSLKEVSDFYLNSVKTEFKVKFKNSLACQHSISKKLIAGLEYFSNYLGAKAADLWIVDDSRKKSFSFPILM